MNQRVFSKSEQKECPTWIMDHVKRVVPDIQWQKEIDGRWPDRCFILPRLENEVIAEWFEAIEEKIKDDRCEVIIALVPSWPNQFWYKTISHTSFGFQLAGEIRFEGEDIPFPGGLTLAVFGNALPVANYLTSLIRDPKGLGPKDFGLDASVIGGSVAGLSMHLMEVGSIPNIVTPVDSLIDVDRENYGRERSIASAKRGYGTFKHQESRLKDKLWAKRNPADATLAEFNNRIEEIKDFLGRVADSEDEYKEELADGDVEWVRDDASSVIERQDQFRVKVEELAADAEKANKKIKKDHVTKPAFEELLEEISKLPKWELREVKVAQELLASAETVEDLKKKHDRELKEAAGLVKISGGLKETTGVKTGGTKKKVSKSKASPKIKVKLHRDDLVGKADDDKWKVFDKFMAKFEEMRANGDLTDGSLRQYKNHARSLMKEHGLDWKKR